MNMKTRMMLKMEWELIVPNYDMIMHLITLRSSRIYIHVPKRETSALARTHSSQFSSLSYGRGCSLHS